METTNEMLRMVRKKLSQSKTIMIGWHKARTMNLEENGARLREKPSSVFKCIEWR